MECVDGVARGLEHGEELALEELQHGLAGRVRSIVPLKDLQTRGAGGAAFGEMRDDDRALLAQELIGDDARLANLCAVLGAVIHGGPPVSISGCLRSSFHFVSVLRETTTRAAELPHWQVYPYPEQHPVPVQVPVIMFRWMTPVLFLDRKCPTPSLSPPPVL